VSVRDPSVVAELTRAQDDVLLAGALLPDAFSFPPGQTVVVHRPRLGVNLGNASEWLSMDESSKMAVPRPLPSISRYVFERCHFDGPSWALRTSSLGLDDWPSGLADRLYLLGVYARINSRWSDPITEVLRMMRRAESPGLQFAVKWSAYSAWDDPLDGAWQVSMDGHAMEEVARLLGEESGPADLGLERPKITAHWETMLGGRAEGNVTYYRLACLRNGRVTSIRGNAGWLQPAEEHRMREALLCHCTGPETAVAMRRAFPRSPGTLGKLLECVLQRNAGRESIR
jgi:hypothetical protein